MGGDRRVRYPSKPLIFNSTKLGSFGGGGEGSGFNYSKRYKFIKLSSLSL
jgi:hypothetical protein